MDRSYLQKLATATHHPKVVVAARYVKTWFESEDTHNKLNVSPCDECFLSRFTFWLFVVVIVVVVAYRC